MRDPVVHYGASHVQPPRMQPLARLPIFLALEGKRVLVAGTGAAAAWKAELLSPTDPANTGISSKTVTDPQPQPLSRTPQEGRGCVISTGGKSDSHGRVRRTSGLPAARQ
jgi:cation diffusion facilitator CzcD-associated flavoprotein CzcO